MASRLAEADASRRQLEAQLQSGLEREAAQTKLAAAAALANLALSETVRALRGAEVAREASERALALELRALEAELALGAERESSCRATGQLQLAQFADGQADAECRLSLAAKGQRGAERERDETAKALAERVEEERALEAKAGALERGSEMQQQLIRELGTMLHSAQQQLLNGPASNDVGSVPPRSAAAGGASSRPATPGQAGARAGELGGIQRGPLATLPPQRAEHSKPAPRGAGSGGALPSPVHPAADAAVPPHRAAGGANVLPHNRGVFGRMQSYGYVPSAADMAPVARAPPTAALHPYLPEGGGPGPQRRDGARNEPTEDFFSPAAGCGAGATPDNYSSRDMPPARGGGASTAPPERPGAFDAWASEPAPSLLPGQQQEWPSDVLSAAGGEWGLATAERGSLHRHSLNGHHGREPPPPPLAVARPVAQASCPQCDDELYGICHKCSKCLREFHAHCAKASLEPGRSSVPTRWTCPDCSKAKGTTSSSHADPPLFKRRRGH
ncbi:hypothetical protein T492DRAFT_1079329 [Pavlovales sp. CCMP2436]|nr:hypothetical protein T492DRAFT_1079329 [Pavlovales sp. CCMP2436]